MTAPLAPFVEPAEVLSRSDVVLADTRWYLDGRSGRDEYLAGHIDGAVFVDVDRDLAAPPSMADGRHPMPTAETFAATLGQLGIGPNDTVVAYDDTGGMTAGRLAWMLRVTGCDAAVLNGGIAGWPEPLVSGEVSRPPVERPVVPWPAELLVTADEVAEAVGAGAFVTDARLAERHTGEVEPVDSRPGHIPGTNNVPWNANLDAGGQLLSPGVLRELYAGAADGASAIAYCGSGVSACLNLLAMEVAFGQPTGRLYAGSWSQWSADPSRPAVTGN